MNNVFERLFGIHIDDEPMTPNQLNDVETLNSADYDGAPFIPVLYGTDDNPLTVVMPGAIRTIDTPATSFSTQAFNLPTLGQIVQIGNYNPFRRRYCFRPWTNNVWLCDSYENAAATARMTVASQNVDAPAFLPTNDTSIYSTGPLWAVCTLAGVANNFHVLQEFYDGGGHR